MEYDESEAEAAAAMLSTGELDSHLDAVMGLAWNRTVRYESYKNGSKYIFHDLGVY